MPRSGINRRNFVQVSLAASLGVCFGGVPHGLNGQIMDRPVSFGFVGTGSRGLSLLRTALDLGVKVPAVCDINTSRLEQACKLVEQSGQPKPESYARGPEDYHRLAERIDLDLILTATPWELHTPVMLSAMETGKYGATEVPAALTVDECWQLVETSEGTGMPCMMLENVCYYRNVMAVLNMVEQGMFGELLHCEGGYQHDARAGILGPRGEMLWYDHHAATRNGNLYPTHPIGPIAWWLGINRGDRFSHLVSMSSKGISLNQYLKKKYGGEHSNANRNFALGDINTTLIRTANGCTVTLYYDTHTPRPYDLGFRLQGTKGIYSGSLNKIYLEGRSPEEHTWEDFELYFEEYQHPLWKKEGETARKYGHHGGDYMQMRELIIAVSRKLPTPIDVYDSVTWSVISPLSEKSVAERSATVDFPDFTRGNWIKRRKIDILGL